ncbi:MAG: PfkB family carbohydrate kinase [Thermoplasmatota archaeon]
MIDVFGTVALDTVALVPRLPDANEVARVSEMEMRHGGAAGNVAMALARLGAQVRLISVVGRDFADSAYERELLAARVDLSRLVRTEGKTPHAILASDPNGAQHIYFYPGDEAAFSRVAPVPSALAHFAAGDISRYPTLMGACERVTFDPGQETFHRDLAEIVRCASLVDIWFVNAHELARLARDAHLGVPEMLEAGAEAVVETQGSAGARIHTAAAATDVPAVPAEARDPTGAGDAHRAGFLFGLARGWPLVECARFGAVVAAFAVEAVGAQANLPSLAQVRDRYRRFFGADSFS